MHHPLLPLALSSLLIAPACGSADYDENGKPTLDGTGYQDPLGKADALNGPRGPSPRVDNQSTQVWPVENQWADRDTPAAREAGMAWGENSGMSWTEKFHAWVDSLEKDGRTFTLTTPYGKSIGAPALECAEAAMFLRIAFSAWYKLPFYITGHDNGRVFFGHFGIIRADGSRWNNMPSFKRRFDDFTHMADQVRANPDAWPRDEKLRDKKIIGRSSDFQPAIDAEHAGAFFDEVFLNKRVGYFLALQLGFNGSIHLADSANTFNLRPDSFEPGDFLVERFGFSGIGHTVVIKEVIDNGTIEIDGETYKTREVEVMSGTMPRRQPLWEGPGAAKSFYFGNSHFGGEASVEFGAGLKRWRAPRVINGRYRNAVPAASHDLWINSNAHSKLAARTELYEQILVERSPEERMAEIAMNIEFQREHLRSAPSSCSARIRRETAFASLYELAADEFGMSKSEVDAEHRKFEDYVFAELVYDKSKTCCWNSSNNDMYQAAMLFNECLSGLTDDPACDAVETHEQCTDLRVFRGHADDGDGFETLRQFAPAERPVVRPVVSRRELPAGRSQRRHPRRHPADRAMRDLRRRHAVAVAALLGAGCGSVETIGFDLELDDDTLADLENKFDDRACADFEGGELSGDDLLVLVNKTEDQQLASGWAPADLVPVPGAQMMPGRSGELRHGVTLALEAMLAAAAEDDLALGVRSAYRSYRTQCITFAFKVRQHGLDHARRFSAEPGRSQHQLGTTVDITSARLGWALAQSLGDEPEGEWLEANAHRFGFALSYPAGVEHVTGYAFEPWHYRYIGVAAAAEMHAREMILEEYLAACAAGADELACPREELPVPSRTTAGSAAPARPTTTAPSTAASA